MRALVQRVRRAAVRVEGEVVVMADDQGKVKTISGLRSWPPR